MEKIVVRTGGFATVLFGFFALVCATAAIGSFFAIRDELAKALYGGLCALLFASWCITYIWVNQIQLADGILRHRAVSPACCSLIKVMMQGYTSIAISDIKEISLDTGGGLLETSEHKSFMKDYMSQIKWRSQRVACIAPYILIQRNDGIKHLIFTKPFSKKAIISLFDGLGVQGVRCIDENNLLR